MIGLWAASVALGASSLAAAARIAWRRGAAPPLPAALADPPATLVLVPMRDEERNVAGVLESLLAQAGRPRVRVIDDASSDRTAELVAELARREPRLELREAGPLPPGWHGKAHALERGSADAAEPWLLLTDADTRHAPDLLARAHAAARQTRLQAVSLAGRQEARRGEALVTPIVFALLDAMLGDWRRAASDGPAVANGQFILVERAALERCGGFAAVRDAPLDDVALARALRAAGARTGFWRSDGLRVRMYIGLGATLRGWRRNLAPILGERPAVAALALGALTVPGAAAAAALAAGAPLPAIGLWAAGAVAEIVLRATSRHPLWPAWIHPLSPWLTAALVATALVDWRRGRLAAWKGRRISRAAGR